jgi:hypothetical protein
MILLSNHLLTLPEFRDIDNVVIRINMAYVQDIWELEKFVSVKYDILLDYPKSRTKPPKPVLHIPDALDIMKEYKNVKYFATSNIEEVSEVNLICEILPEGVAFVPKIETLKGVLNLDKLLDTDKIRHIMLDSEDLYTDIRNDVELFLNLKNRVNNTCDEYDVELLELYGVVFNGK